MAISHICLSCGFDLARIRAALDSRLGLPLVHCPRCRAVSVRRRHPILRRWRESRRLILALIVLAAQVAVLTFCTVCIIAMCHGAGRVFERGWIGLSDDRALAALQIATLVGPPLVLGAWLTTGLAHWGRWRAWIAFTLFIVLLLSMDTIIVPTMVLIVRERTDALASIPIRPDLWAIRVLSLGVLMVVATVGIPVGRLAGLAIRAAQGHLWRVRRRRRRIRRHCR